LLFGIAKTNMSLTVFAVCFAPYTGTHYTGAHYQGLSEGGRGGGDLPRAPSLRGPKFAKLKGFTHVLTGICPPPSPTFLGKIGAPKLKFATGPEFLS
jgi:hypothetical protein